MATRKAVHFSEVTAEIGKLTVNWSFLEFVIDRLISVLSGMATFEECDIFLSSLDVRQKVQIAKSLVVLRPIDEKWKEKVISILDKVTNELRNTRNEVIHSRWFLTKTGSQQQRVKIRISRPQARMPLEISTLEKSRPNLRKMRNTTRAIIDFANELSFLWSYAGVWQANAEGSPSISYRQYLLKVRSESHRREKQKAPSRPRKSFRA